MSTEIAKKRGRPATGRKTSAEYQELYRIRMQLIELRGQVNWMLDQRLIDAIRAEASARKVHESQLVDEILHTWYEARFEGRLPVLPHQRKDKKP